MSVSVNWRGSDELRDGAAKAPTDTGLEGGNPAALDGDGREHLERKELVCNTSDEDPCLWLRKNSNGLAKFRPGALALIVDCEVNLPVAGSAAAKRLRRGDSVLVRFAADGHTPLNRLVLWDGEGGSGSFRKVPDKLTELEDVVQGVTPNLGEVPLWLYAANGEAQARWQFGTANAHIKTWDSVRHWESGAVVFHHGRMWRAIHDNTNIEPKLEDGKVMLFLHVLHEPTFGIVPMSLGAAAPPTGSVTADATHSHYAYHLQYGGDTQMTIWKFVVTGKDPTTGHVIGEWQGRPWQCIAWRRRSAPPSNFPPGMAIVWINCDPGTLVLPVLGQQTWAAMDLTGSLMSCADVKDAIPQNQDLLSYDAIEHKWEPVPRTGLGWQPVDATTAIKGLVQLADAAAITAGASGRVVDAAQLKVVRDQADTAKATADTALAAANGAWQPVDATTTIKGLVQLADEAAISAGTPGRVVDAAQLKAGRPGAVLNVKHFTDPGTGTNATSFTNANISNFVYTPVSNNSKLIMLASFNSISDYAANQNYASRHRIAGPSIAYSQAYNHAVVASGGASGQELASIQGSASNNSIAPRTIYLEHETANLVGAKVYTYNIELTIFEIAN